MERSFLIQRLRDAFGEAIGEYVELTNGTEYQRKTGSYLAVNRTESLRDIAFFLRDEEGFDFDNLVLLSGVDNADGTLSVTYHLESLREHHFLTLKVRVPIDSPEVPSITDIWSHANWHEREAQDLLGLRFIGHPDPRPLLLEEDWPGHPLRKDYRDPEFYRGMKVPY